MNKIKHNGKISFWEFMFSLMIVALHLGVLNTNAEYRFSYGSIAVDFFYKVLILLSIKLKDFYHI